MLPYLLNGILYVLLPSMTRTFESTMDQIENIKLIKDFRSNVPLVANNPYITYLNSAFQTPMNTLVYDAIEEYNKDSLYNPNPKNKWVLEAEVVRAKFAKLIGASSDDIVFTRDATEGSNLFQRSLKFKRGDNVILLKGDFPSFISGWIGLASDGLEIKYVEVDNSNPKPCDVETLKPYIDENTVAIGVSSVMFQTGILNNIKSICDEFRPMGIHVLVDATQEIAFSKIDVRELGVSAMTFGVQKGLSTPTGLGLLYISPCVLSDLKETPPIVSVYSLKSVNEPYEFVTTSKKYEHTNKALLQCLALGRYIDFIERVGIENIQKYIEGLGAYLRTELNEIGVTTLGPSEKSCRSSHINAIPLMGTSWKNFFENNKVYVTHNKHGIRVSMGVYNSKEDIDKFIRVIKMGLDSGL